MKKEVRLYNILMPIWLMFLWPTKLWLLILPLNFIVDSLVLCISVKRQQVGGITPVWKNHILPLWCIGFLSDLIGALLIMALCLLLEDIPRLHLFPGTTLISIPGVALAGLLIYWLNRKLTFRKSALDPDVVHKLCLHLALWTAPYTMLIPLYG